MVVGLLLGLATNSWKTNHPALVTIAMPKTKTMMTKGCHTPPTNSNMLKTLVSCSIYSVEKENSCSKYTVINLSIISLINFLKKFMFSVFYIIYY